MVIRYMLDTDACIALIQKLGTPIGAMDLLIASHALFIDSVLVTNNTREFERVPDLRIENWLF